MLNPIAESRSALRITNFPQHSPVLFQVTCCSYTVALYVMEENNKEKTYASFPKRAVFLFPIFER